MIFVTYWFIVGNMNSWHSSDFHTDESNIFEMIWEIYIRLDSNTTRYTRHKLHLLTLTIHLYLNCSHHTFIKSCVIRSWSTWAVKKYISKKNSYHNSLQSPLLVASVMELKWVNCVVSKLFIELRSPILMKWHRVWCRNGKTLIMRRLLF